MKHSILVPGSSGISASHLAMSPLLLRVGRRLRVIVARAGLVVVQRKGWRRTRVPGGVAEVGHGGSRLGVGAEAQVALTCPGKEVRWQGMVH